MGRAVGVVPVAGEKAAWVPCQAPLEVPQKVDQRGAVVMRSTGDSCSCTRTCPGTARVQWM